MAVSRPATIPPPGGPTPSIAHGALPALALFQPALSSAVFARAGPLALPPLLAPGRRPVPNLPRAVGPPSRGAPPSYPPPLPQARWPGPRLAALLARSVLRRFWPPRGVPPLGDDTVTEHPGRK